MTALHVLRNAPSSPNNALPAHPTAADARVANLPPAPNIVFTEFHNNHNEPFQAPASNSAPFHIATEAASAFIPLTNPPYSALKLSNASTAIL